MTSGLRASEQDQLDPAGRGQTFYPSLLLRRRRGRDGARAIRDSSRTSETLLDVDAVRCEVIPRGPPGPQLYFARQLCQMTR